MAAEMAMAVNDSEVDLIKALSQAPGEPLLRFRVMPKGKAWRARFPEGVLINIPAWLVALAGIVGIVIVFDLVERLIGIKARDSPCDKYGEPGFFETFAGFGGLGLIGLPLSDMSKKKREEKLAACIERNAPAATGITDIERSFFPTNEFVLFVLSNGDEYHTIFIPAGVVDEFPNGHVREFWILNDGTEAAPTGPFHERMKAQARSEGKWPARKLTPDERQEAKDALQG